MKLINILIISLLINNLWGQDLTVNETVNYINKKLKENPKVSNNGYKTNKTEFQIELTTDGYLITLEYTFSKQNNESTFSECSLAIEKFLISTATVNEVTGSLVYPQGTIEFGRIKTLKKGYGDCNSKNIQLSDYNSSTSIVAFSNEEIIREPLLNAFNHLFNSVKSDPNYLAKSDPNDPFASKMINRDKLTTGTSSNIIKMESIPGGLHKVPVVLNGVLKISFIYDSGASDVSISPDVALTLIKTGTLSDSDYIGIQTYVFADGTKAKSKRIIIRELQIGNQTINNVEASISNSINAPMLLGQSVLKRFGRVTVDNNTNSLIIER